MIYDVIIIGCGVVGGSVAYELSHYDVKALVLEAENDIATGTTKANSGIVHGGYDPKPGTLMAKLNVIGANLMEQYCEKLNVPYKKTGSLVVAFNQDELKTIKKLYNRGIENGVLGLEILSGEQVAEKEPNLAKVAGALYSKNAGVVSPWELALGLSEFSATNGVEFKLNSKVLHIEQNGDVFVVKTKDNTFETKNIVNCAGLNADAIHDMMSETRFKTEAQRGQYFLLDSSQNNLVSHVIFQCPNELGKGILVSPTAHGNIIIGPDNQTVEGNDVSVTREGLSFIEQAAKKSVPNIDVRSSIRNFAGVRSVIENYDDFLIQETKKGFFEACGIKSPGLVSSIAIGKYIVELMEKSRGTLNKKQVVDYKRNFVYFKHLSTKQRDKLIKQNPSYGRIICRCETVTEGEVIDALNSPIRPVSVDGVKRRCAAGSGRCQGGFCSPRVMELISEYNGVSLDEIPLDKEGSYITTGDTKGENKDV